MVINNALLPPSVVKLFMNDCITQLRSRNKRFRTYMCANPSFGDSVIHIRAILRPIRQLKIWKIFRDDGANRPVPAFCGLARDMG